MIYFLFLLYVTLFSPAPVAGPEIPIGRVDLFIDTLDGTIYSRIGYDPLYYHTECDMFVDIERAAKSYCTESEMQLRRDYLKFKERFRKL